jgi:hypothetical protein
MLAYAFAPVEPGFIADPPPPAAEFPAEGSGGLAAVGHDTTKVARCRMNGPSGVDHGAEVIGEVAAAAVLSRFGGALAPGHGPIKPSLAERMSFWAPPCAQITRGQSVVFDVQVGLDADIFPNLSLVALALYLRRGWRRPRSPVSSPKQPRAASKPRSAGDPQAASGRGQRRDTVAGEAD